jgi:hypothetical protein
VSDVLELPAIEYGLHADVRRRASAAMRRFAAGTPWADALEAGDRVSTATSPGLVVLNGPAPLLAAEPNFHAFLPLALVLEGVRKGKLDDGLREEATLASLDTPWGLLGVLAPVNQMLVYPPSTHRPVLEAAVRWWDVLDAVGPRYTTGLREGARLWSVVNNLHFVLGRFGVSDDTLRTPLPTTGLRGIVPPGVLD